MSVPDETYIHPAYSMSSTSSLPKSSIQNIPMLYHTTSGCFIIEHGDVI